VIGSILTLASFMKVQRYGFHSERIIESITNKIGFRMNAAMITLALLCILTSLLVIPGIMEVTLEPVANVLLNKANYIQLVLGR